MNAQRRHTLVLSVYFTSRGFAFTLFESPLSPFDWGVRDVRGKRKEKRSLAQILALLDLYLPDVLVLQNTSPGGTRRAWRLIRSNMAVSDLAEKRGIPVFFYARADVNVALGTQNKHALAELIAKHIPAFERYVPPPRKSWMSEDSRMSLFDAAALALVFLQWKRRQSH